MTKRAASLEAPSQAGVSRLWLVAALALALLQAIPNLCYPIGRDQATYAVIARGLLQGQSLYRDLWDNKPPGIFYVYTPIVRIFGPVMWSIGVVDILWLLAISFCIFRFAEWTLGKPAACLAVVINAAMHVRAGPWDAAQPETFAMLFIFASYLLLRVRVRRITPNEFCAGVLFAAAFWVKYNAVFFLPFVFLLPYLDVEDLDGRPWRLRPAVPPREGAWKAAKFALGFASVSSGLLLYLWSTGSWNSFREEHFQALARYSYFAIERTPHYWIWAADHIEFWLGSWTLCAAIAALGLAWWRRDLARPTPALVGAAVGFAALAIQIRFQPYYFETCYPFFATLWAYLAIQIWEGARFLSRYFLERNWHVARPLVWVAFAGLMALPLPAPVVRTVVNYQALNEWRQDSRRSYSSYTWPGAAEHYRDVLSIVAFLKENPALGRGVFVWGNEPLIYYLSGHQPPTRFVWNLPLIAVWRLSGWRRQFIQQLTTSRPRFIVVAQKDEVHDLSYTFQDSKESIRGFPELDNYLRSFYRLCKEFGTLEMYCRSSSKP